jgi:hypothetical protein
MFGLWLCGNILWIGVIYGIFVMNDEGSNDIGFLLHVHCYVGAGGNYCYDCG